MIWNSAEKWSLRSHDLILFSIRSTQLCLLVHILHQEWRQLVRVLGSHGGLKVRRDAEPHQSSTFLVGSSSIRVVAAIVDICGELSSFSQCLLLLKRRSGAVDSMALLYTHFSEIRGSCLMKWPSETFQNVNIEQVIF